jgi:hypothetical protein
MEYETYLKERINLTKINDADIRMAAASALEYRRIETMFKAANKSLEGTTSPLKDYLAGLSDNLHKIMQCHREIFHLYANYAEVDSVLSLE